MEIEFKLSCSPETAKVMDRQLTRLTGAPPHKLRLQNTYYDTPNQDLRAQGIALRIRKQDDLELQTVKCAGLVSGGLSSRPEWETPYGGRFDFSPVDDLKVRERLETLFRLPGYRATLDTNFSRHVWHWRPAADTHVEVVLDRGRILAGGREEAICEIELELVEGQPERLLDLVAHLATLAPLFPAPLSKATRGSLLLGSSLQTAIPPPSHTDSCRDAFNTLAQSCLDHISINLPTNCRRFTDENLHQVRAGLRRLRALLQLFRPVLRQGWPRQAITQGARDHMAMLASARNQHVLLTCIVNPALATTSFRDGQRLQRNLARMSDTAFAAAEAYLLSQEFSNWLLHTSLALHTGPLKTKAGDRNWAEQAPKLLRPRLADFGRHFHHLPTTPGAMHELRKASKHLRYQLAIATLNAAPRQVHAIKRLSHLQASLGQINDLYSAAEIFGRLPSSYGATIAAIGKHHVAQHDELQKQAAKQLKRLRQDMRTLHTEPGRA